MFLRNLNLTPFYSPDDALSDSGPLSVEDMIESLGDETPDDKTADLLSDDESDDDKLDKKDKKKSDKEKTDKTDKDNKINKNDKADKEDKEDKEDEIDLDEPELDESDLDDTSDVPRKEILKAYPDLFKKFPQLERAYYREQKYAEYFPTLDDAKQATEKIQNFDKFEGSLLQGSLNTVLDSLKTADEQAYNKIVNNYLDDLGKVDKEAYFHTISNVVKSTISAMVTEASRTNNEDLKTAAVILNQFVTGTSEYKPPVPFKDANKNENDPEREKLLNERKQFVQERFTTTLEDVSSRARNAIKSTVMAHIDPKGAMTDYIKKVAVNEVIEAVESGVVNDTRFKANLDKLWEQAFRTNFKKDAVDNILKAYLNKAKTLLPSSIQKSRNAALKGLGKKVVDDNNDDNNDNDNTDNTKTQKRGNFAAGRNTSGDNRSNSKVPKDMKTLDFLMQD